MKPKIPRLRRLFLMTFMESFATILLERGIYFFSQDRLDFGDAENLLLALSFGATYVIGSLLSHPASARIREKPLLIMGLTGQIATAIALALWVSPATLFGLWAVMGLLFGLKWPLIESYVCANQTPPQIARSVGIFNFCWSSAVPLALAAAGPLIAVGPIVGGRIEALFISVAAISAVTILLMQPLPRKVQHLPRDHPDRAPGERIGRYKALLISSRSLMMASYSSLWIMAALMPGIFKGLSQPVVIATALSAVVDVARVVAFVALQYYTGWHNRSLPLVAAMVALPIGFFTVLFGPNLTVVVIGEAIFGLAAGLVYYAALYYAMIVMNASVEAGGGHEALIGSGFALGPACGLLSLALGPLVQSRLLGTITGVGPLFVACSVVAVWAISRRRE
ncbi:MAG: MFS transporter [Planctomycetota bacterium]|jgi:MFS family permease